MFPKREEIALGVGFTNVPTEKFKVNRIDVRFTVPLKKETAAENALIFPVAFRATEKYPGTKQIRIASEELYGTSVYCDVSKRGDAQIISVGVSFLSDKYSYDGTYILDGALSLLGEVMMHPLKNGEAFVFEYVESEKQKLIDEEMARINDKRRYAQTRMCEEMFEGDPFSVSENGDIESIKAVTPESLYAAYRRIVEGAKAEIVSVGDMDAAAVRAFFIGMFGAVPRGECEDVLTEVKKAPRKKVKYVYEHQNVTQGKLSLGFYTGIGGDDERETALSVMNSVFGAGTTSKLFMNVREKLSLCYYCSSGINTQKGYMAVNSGILFENEKKAVDEILAQLDAIADGEITDFELDSAKNGLCDRYRSIFDKASSISSYVYGETVSGKLEMPEEKIKKIRAVTKEDVMEVAKGIKLDTYYFLCGKESENE